MRNFKVESIETEATIIMDSNTTLNCRKKNINKWCFNLIFVLITKYSIVKVSDFIAKYNIDNKFK